MQVDFGLRAHPDVPGRRGEKIKTRRQKAACGKRHFAKKTAHFSWSAVAQKSDMGHIFFWKKYIHYLKQNVEILTCILLVFWIY